MIVRDTEGKGLGLLRGPDVKSWIFGKLYKPSGWGDAAKVRFSTSPNLPLLLFFSSGDASCASFPSTDMTLFSGDNRT